MALQDGGLVFMHSDKTEIYLGYHIYSPPLRRKEKASIAPAMPWFLRASVFSDLAPETRAAGVLAQQTSHTGLTL